MLNKKRLLIFVLGAILAFLLVGCNKGTVSNNSKKADTIQKNSAYPMTVTDSYNRQVIIEKEPRRVISIAPNITEIVFALDKSKKLVGRTEYCNYPAATKKITSIGSLTEPNIEKIVDLKPDLVIASTHFKKDILQKLEEVGIKVAILYGEESFNGVYETIGKVGKVLNADDKANTIISEMKSKVKDAKDRVKNKKQPVVYYVISYGKSGDYTAGKDTFIEQMIEMAGGKNAASDTKGWSYSLEKLVEKSPEIVICSKYFNAKQGIESTNGYKDLPAVKEKKLFTIDNNLLDRQGPRLADGLVELTKIIHPEAFK